MCVYFSSDYRGGFQLQPAQDAKRERHLLEELDSLRVSSHKTGRLPPSRPFTPLLDIPVDGYAPPTSVLRSRSPSPAPPNWLLTESPRSTTTRRGRSPPRRDNGSAHSREPSDRGETTSRERGRSPYQNANGRRDRAQTSGNGTDMLPVSAPQRSRPPLAQVFSPQEGLRPPDRSPSAGRLAGAQVNGHTRSPQNGHHDSHRAQEYQLTTVSIPKTKQSLGECHPNQLRPRAQQ